MRPSRIGVKMVLVQVTGGLTGEKMSVLGDEYADAARQLAVLRDRYLAARLAGNIEQAEKLHVEVLDMFVKVEKLHKQWQLEHPKMGGN